jgi:hypothetical protein
MFVHLADLLALRFQKPEVRPRQANLAICSA